MQTRRDQLQAYRFLNRRALAALVTGEPNAVDPPMRRLTATTVSGIMIAALVVAGFAILGIIHPSVGNSWKDSGTIIVERETGARYVLLKNVLHPVVNYSSGVLAVAGQSQSTVKVVLVNRSDLKNTKRGATIGINGIPDSLPQAGSLVHSPFAVCSRLQPEQPTGLEVRVSVNVGSSPGTAAVPRDSAIIASTPTQTGTYLVWHGNRLLIGSADVSTALGIANAPKVTVGTAFLDALTPGANLTTPRVTDFGQTPASTVGSHLVVGQLLETSQNGPYWVMLHDGIASVNKVQAELLQTLQLPDHTHLPPVQTTEAAVLDITQSRAGWAELKSQFDGLPTSMPAIDSGPAQNGGVCANFDNGANAPTLSTPPSLLPDNPGGTISESAESTGGLADTVQVAPGRAAVVQSTDGSQTVFVLADPGRKYAASSVGALAGFGYGSVKPVLLPPQVLGLIPRGNALDATAARRPVS